MLSNRYAVTRAAGVLAVNPGLGIAGLMRAARCSSGIAQRAIAEVSEPAVIHAKPVAVPAEIGVRNLVPGPVPVPDHKAELTPPANVSPAKRRPVARVPAKDASLASGQRWRGRPSKRAQALVREQLKHGPRSGAQVEAAAQAAEISKYSLIAATDALGVRTRKGQWWLPS